MVIYFLNHIVDVFSSCASWTGRLFASIGGNGVVLAAFILSVVMSILFIPLRGSGVSGFTSYTKNEIHKSIKRSGNKRGD